MHGPFRHSSWSQGARNAAAGSRLERSTQILGGSPSAKVQGGVEEGRLFLNPLQTPYRGPDDGFVWRRDGPELAVKEGLFAVADD